MIQNNHVVCALLLLPVSNVHAECNRDYMGMLEEGAVREECAGSIAEDDFLLSYPNNEMKKAIAASIYASAGEHLTINGMRYLVDGGVIEIDGVERRGNAIGVFLRGLSGDSLFGEVQWVHAVSSGVGVIFTVRVVLAR